MFEIERHKSFITDHYFRLLRDYGKPDLLRQFIERWIDLLVMYSSKSHFSCFDPPVPILNRIVSKAKSVLVVPFGNTPVPHLPRCTIFPLYPFRIHTSHHVECSRDGLEMLQLYLKLTNVRIVGFYKFKNDHILAELRKMFPHITVYNASLFSSFRKMSKLALFKSN